MFSENAYFVKLNENEFHRTCFQGKCLKCSWRLFLKQPVMADSLCYYFNSIKLQQKSYFSSVCLISSSSDMARVDNRNIWKRHEVGPILALFWCLYYKLLPDNYKLGCLSIWKNLLSKTLLYFNLSSHSVLPPPAIKGGERFLCHQPGRGGNC